MHLVALCWLFIIGWVSLSAHGQWITQNVALTNGWNAVYLHVDASHTTLNDSVASDPANPILEVWRWHPSTSLQFVESPTQPLDTGSQFSAWDRSDPVSPLQRIVGNSAYLVRVGTNVSTYIWAIKGKPVAPVNEWSTTGLNFIGFPTVPVNPPVFERFLGQAPELLQSVSTEIYSYPGGELGTNNPARLLAFRGTKVNRGQAFWMRSGTRFNRYFGPFELDLNGESGLEFGARGSSQAFFLRNLTASNLTVTLDLLPSEQPPVGQPAIQGVPPLLLRGALNLTNMTYSYVNLAVGSGVSWTLPPMGQSGSELEVVLGVNQFAMTNSPGSSLAGVLRVTDSFGYTQLDTAVSATAGSNAGLWVGNAVVSGVAQYLKSFVTNSQGDTVVGANGQYLANATNTSMAGVSRPYALRLIVHNPATGHASLLQRVFIGLGSSTNLVAATQEKVLHPGYLSQARRITATHLPWSEANTPWQFDGSFGNSSNIASRIVIPYDDHTSNPFLHAYHPDHDNLDATFKRELAQGGESYDLQRDITLSIRPPSDDYVSLISAGSKLQGDYRETLRIVGLPRAGGTNDTREFQVAGRFTLTRLAEVPQLTLAP